MSLEAILQRMIKLDGPMRLDRFMAILTNHYYENHHIFGPQGDFITAPEISPHFSYAISNWLYAIWQNHNKPKLQIVEMGPGNGTMMHDLLHGNSRYPDLQAAMQPTIMIERSKELIARQQEKLKGHNITWRDSLDDIGNYFTIIIANEFFDAMPVRQWISEDAGWSEIFITFNQTEGFQLVKGAGFLDATFPVGSIIETSPQSTLYATEISQALKTFGGAALIIDYGYIEPPMQSTLQAVKNHKHHKLLDDIGTADWTAHVNFAELSKILQLGSSHCKVSTQRDFLIGLGIENMMLKNPHSLNRLIGEKQMGVLFKVLEVIYSPTHQRQ